MIQSVAFYKALNNHAWEALPLKALLCSFYYYSTMAKPCTFHIRQKLFPLMFSVVYGLQLIPIIHFFNKSITSNLYNLSLCQTLHLFGILLIILKPSKGFMWSRFLHSRCWCLGMIPAYLLWWMLRWWPDYIYRLGAEVVSQCLHL